MKRINVSIIRLTDKLEVTIDYFGYFFLLVLHGLYSLILIVTYQISKLFSILNSLNITRTEPSDCLVEIQKEVKLFNKVPNHLVLVLGSEEPSYGDFVKILIWCLPAGISYISFYDHKNSIDSNIFFGHVLKLGKQYIPNIKWGKSFDEEIKNKSKTSINGFKWNPKLTVNIYSKENGLNCLTEVAKELHKEDVHSIDQRRLNSIMRKRFSAPDPDLAIVCGDVLSYYAFPPWHLRITQILHIKSHHNVAATKFLQMLTDYCKCEQRCGK